MTIRLLALACVAGLPCAAAAADFSSVVALGYGHSSISNGGGDADVYSLELFNSVDFQNGFTLDFDVNYQKVDPDGAGDADLFGLAAAGRYRFASGLTLGGYVEHDRLDISGLAVDLDATSYGLSAGYASDGMRVEAFYGMTETDPSLPGGTDVHDFGLLGSMKVADSVSLSGGVTRSRIDTPAGDADADRIQLGGSYGVTSDLSVFAGVSHLDVDVLNADATTYGLGLAFDMSNVASVPATVSLELARSDVSIPGGSGDMDTIRLGVSMPLGGKAKGMPANSVAGSIVRPRHSAIVGSALSAF